MEDGDVRWVPTDQRSSLSFKTVRIFVLDKKTWLYNFVL